MKMSPLAMYNDTNYYPYIVPCINTGILVFGPQINVRFSTKPLPLITRLKWTDVVLVVLYKETQMFLKILVDMLSSFIEITGFMIPWQRRRNNHVCKGSIIAKSRFIVPDLGGFVSVL